MILALMLMAAAEVPAVGCAGGGQQYRPAQTMKSVMIAQVDPKAAEQLAWYDFGFGLGVLAPRGWTCWGMMGSGGVSLAVSPDSAEKVIMKHEGEFPGPAIKVFRAYGFTSGRFTVADYIARFFPAYRSFYSSFQRDYGWTPDSTLFTADKPFYIAKTAFEFVTPPNAKGLGSWSLGSGKIQTYGIVMLTGKHPDLIHLAVRLPTNLSHLAPTIIAQTRRHPWDKFDY